MEEQGVDPLNLEVQNFIDDVSEALQFATDVINQLPTTDPRRTRLAEQLNTQIQKYVEQHDNDSKNLFDPEVVNSEQPADAQIKAANLLTNPTSSLVDQMKAIRGYYAGKCWQAVISQLSCLLEENYRGEIVQIGNNQQFDQLFIDYTDHINNCHHVNQSNQDIISTQYNLQQQLITTSTNMNNDLINYSGTKKKIVQEADQAIIQISDQCQQLIQDIDHIKLSLTKQQQENINNSFKCKISILPNQQNKCLVTLPQVINQINEIYGLKQKQDIQQQKQKKQGRTLKQFIYQYYLNKYGNVQYSLKNENTKKFFYSLSYYSQNNSVCKIFNYELNNQIDEAFKLNISKLEAKIDELNQQLLKDFKNNQTNSKNANTSQIQENINYNILNYIYDSNTDIVQMLFKQISNIKSLEEVKNVINLFEVEKHKQLLSQLQVQFQKYDTTSQGVIDVQMFQELVEQNYLKKQDNKELFEQLIKAASKGHREVTFTSAVFVLSQFLFEKLVQSQQSDNQHEEQEEKEGTIKLEVNDL